MINPLFYLYYLIFGGTFVVVMWILVYVTEMIKEDETPLYMDRDLWEKMVRLMK